MTDQEYAEERYRAHHDVIECPQCGAICGTHHAAKINADPNDCYEAYDEGEGENFTDENGEWYCSQECLQGHFDEVKEQEEEEE